MDVDESEDSSRLRGFCHLNFAIDPSHYLPPLDEHQEYGLPASAIRGPGGHQSYGPPAINISESGHHQGFGLPASTLRGPGNHQRYGFPATTIGGPGALPE